MNRKHECLENCNAYEEKAFRNCMALDGVVSLKRMADRVTETSAQIVQQIESSWHPK